MIDYLIGGVFVLGFVSYVSWLMAYAKPTFNRNIARLRPKHQL